MQEHLKSLLNYRALSKVLKGHPTTLRAKSKQPESIKELLNYLEYWYNKHVK